MPANMKEIIAGTFLELSQTKSVDKITVKALVEACGISRQTFYYHFQDILDVIEWSVQQKFQQILTVSQGNQTMEDTLRALIEASADTDTLLQKLLHSQKREQIETIIVQAVRDYLQEILSRQPPEQSLPMADARMALDFCAYGIVGLLLKNCGRPPADRENLARQMYHMFEQLGRRREN